MNDPLRVTPQTIENSKNLKAQKYETSKHCQKYVFAILLKIEEFDVGDFGT